MEGRYRVVLTSHFHLRHPLDGEIARLAIPAFGALIAEPLYVIADTAVVGRIGTDELAGLAVASSVLLIGFSGFIFLAYGTTASVSRLIGAGDHQEAAHQGMQSLWLAAALGITTAVVGMFFAEPVIGLMGGTELSETATTAAVKYFKLSLFGVPFQLAVLAGTGYLRALLDTRTPLIVAVVAAVGNLVLEAWWVFGLGYGIGASATATVVAQVGSAVAYLWVIVRAVRRQGASTVPDLPVIGRLLRVGGDLMLRTVALRAALTVSTAIAARIGTVSVAAHEVGFAIWNLTALTLDALGIAGQSLIGRYIGAAKIDEARDMGRRMIELGVVLGVVVGVAIATTKTFLPPIFTDDAEVIVAASGVLWWVAIMQPVNSVVFVLDGLLIGASDMAFLAKAMVGSVTVFIVAAAAVVFTRGGLASLWAAIAVLMVARLVVLVHRWKSARWINLE